MYDDYFLVISNIMLLIPSWHRTIPLTSRFNVARGPWLCCYTNWSWRHECLMICALGYRDSDTSHSRIALSATVHYSRI